MLDTIIRNGELPRNLAHSYSETCGTYSHVCIHSHAGCLGNSHLINCNLDLFFFSISLLVIALLGLKFMPPFYALLCDAGAGALQTPISFASWILDFVRRGC